MFEIAKKKMSVMRTEEQNKDLEITVQKLFYGNSLQIKKMYN